MHAAGEDSWHEQFVNCGIIITNVKQHSSTLKWWPHLKKAEDGKNQNEAITNTQNHEEPHKATPTMSRCNRHKRIVPVLGCVLFVLAINTLYNINANISNPFFQHFFLYKTKL